MKKVILLSAAALVITACGKSDKVEVVEDNAFETDCLVIANHPDAERALKRSMMAADDFCSCATAMWKDTNEVDAPVLATGISVMSAKLSTEGATDLNDAFEGFVKDAEDHPDDAEKQAAYEGVLMLGDFLDDITGDMGDNEGVCPVEAE